MSWEWPPKTGALSTRELLLIAFLAAFLVAARSAMRWHLQLSGHAMIVTAFALVLVRNCIDRHAASTLCGLIAGIIVAALGMGKGGPLIVPKLVLPGIVIDLGAAAGWRLAGSGAQSETGGESAQRRDLPIGIQKGIVLGGLAGLPGLVSIAIVEVLAEVDTSAIALHLLTAGTGRAAFGAIGGGAAAWVSREVEHHGLLVR